MPPFKIASHFRPTGDQPQAVEKLVDGLRRGLKHQTLLGVTGSGKTFTMACVIEQVQRPTLVIAHNKTLAAQLATEFKEFFPDNAVEYFVSYYDYYQPEAYVPQHDLYIDKEADINEEIDKLRHAATRALLTRRDVIIVASVSCIYGLGSPEEYEAMLAYVRRGQTMPRDRLIRKLVDIQYERNDYELARGRFRVRGDTLEIMPAYEELAVRIEFWGDEVDRIVQLDPLTGQVVGEREDIEIFPAKHFVTTEEKLKQAIADIEEELDEQLAKLWSQGKALEAQRLKARTRYDIEMLRETGYCAGVENYSCHLGRRHRRKDGSLAHACGVTPWCLLHYFPDDYLIFIDESHITLPQIRGMYEGDRSRKETLVEYGFRLPSALDNRPLRFDEFEALVNQIIYVSATPGPYEYEHSQQVVEQVIRPTGLLDPTVEVCFVPAPLPLERAVEALRNRRESRPLLAVTAGQGDTEALKAALGRLGYPVVVVHYPAGVVHEEGALASGVFPYLREGTAQVIEAAGSGEGMALLVWPDVEGSRPPHLRLASLDVVALGPGRPARELVAPLEGLLASLAPLLEPGLTFSVEANPTDHVLEAVNRRVAQGQRSLVTTLTKRMAEELADYLKEMGVKTHYLHSEIDTLERSEILRDLRLGVYDVVVGINLLREGLDLPEVSLVAILDADKEGYLRSETSLIQTMGRAARHVEGHVIMYASAITESMARAIGETNRRRRIQEEYNRRHGITPQGIRKAVHDITERVRAIAEPRAPYATHQDIPREDILRLIKELEAQMKAAARDLEFEKAALLRDQIMDLRKVLAD